MKFPRAFGAFALAFLIIPLAGCVGDEKTEPKPIIDDDGEIDQGIPPKKFSFEPNALNVEGMAKKEKKTTQGGVAPGQPWPLGTERTTWRFSWNVTGLVPIEVTEGAAPEIFYSVWVASKDTSKEEGVTWERVPNSQGPAEGGELSGATEWAVYLKDYLGVLVTLETEDNSQPEIHLLKYVGFKAEEDGEGQLEYLAPFKGAFADATVEVDDAGKVNLTVKASTLPETAGVYDLFLKNGAGNHYLGTLKFDAAQAAYTFSAQPDPALFSKYQFFISIEDKKSPEIHGGYPMLKSKFSK